MKKNNNSSTSDASTSSTDAQESYIKDWELSLANLEKIGALFASFGYLNFFYAANLDTLTILDINTTGRTAEETFVFGQEIISIGYTLLWIVSINRLSLALFKINNTDESVDLPAFQQLRDSYLISLFANLYRLDAFLQLYKDSLNEESSNDTTTKETTTEENIQDLEANNDIF